MSFTKLRSLVLCSLLAALMAAGAYLQVPIGPVPIVLTNLFVLLAGLLLGAQYGLMAAGLYLLLGAVGLPVFAGGKGGLAHLVGPTGGYLFGFAAGAWLTGLVAERFRRSSAGNILAVICGSLGIYALGLPWLQKTTGMTWTKVFLVGMAPFLLGDALKAACAVLLAHLARPILERSATR